MGVILAAATPFLKADHIFAFDGSQIEGIEQLAYFAASVVWRAAARNWHLRLHIFRATNLGATAKHSGCICSASPHSRTIQRLAMPIG
jgi:hypothetical protein